MQKGSDISLLEDPGPIRITGWASQFSAGPISENAQVLTASLTADTPGLFSVQPALNTTTGDLTFTPASNAAGTTRVTLILSDSGGTSNGGVNQYSTFFNITIQPVNDPPGVQISTDPSTLENSGEVTLPNWAVISAGPSNEASQTVTLTVTTDVPALFAVQPEIDRSTQTLSYTPAPNSNGTTRVVIDVSDNGGTNNGGISHTQVSFNITILPVNDPPTMNMGDEIIINRELGHGELHRLGFAVFAWSSR